MPNYETIWHFTCQTCKGWWSYATTEDKWKPKKMFCPHCGRLNEWVDKK
jgi:primosomal protein N'